MPRFSVVAATSSARRTSSSSRRSGTKEAAAIYAAVNKAVFALARVRKRAGQHFGRFPVATLVVQRFTLAQRKLCPARGFVCNFDGVLKPGCGFGESCLKFGFSELTQKLGIRVIGWVLGERSLETAHGGLRRTASKRSVSGRAQQREGFRIGIGRRHQKVRRNLLVGRVVIAEHLRCASMRLTSSERGH